MHDVRGTLRHKGRDEHIEIIDMRREADGSLTVSVVPTRASLLSAMPNPLLSMQTLDCHLLG